MMSIKQSLTITCLAIAGLTLAGCNQHSNPLADVTPDVAAAFLHNTAIAAKTKVGMTGDDDGSEYADCMDKASTDTRCQKLYGEMATLAKDNPSYSKLTAQDITDADLWRSVSSDYKERVFDSIG